MLPKEIFVTNEREDDEDGGWYRANTSAVDAVAGSEQTEPVVVGTYKLVKEESLKLVKTTKVKKTKK